MLFAFIVLGIFFFVIVIIFSSKKLSPIPYFPSNQKDLELIVNTLALKNNQTVFDLGAGDGIVIFTAAKKAWRRKLNTKFIAVEINPILLLILHIGRIFHPNKKSIKIIRENIFSMNFSSLTTDYQLLTTFYLYVSPWFIEKIVLNVKKKLKNVTFVSYMYPIKSLKKREKFIRGKNSIFVYP